MEELGRLGGLGPSNYALGIIFLSVTWHEVEQRSLSDYLKEILRVPDP